MNLPSVVFIAIGFMVGGGIFAFTGIVARITGPLLPLAYCLAAIPVFVSMFPVAMLGSAFPTTGGSYKYPSRMFSPAVAFTGVWTYALCSFFGQIPLLAHSCAGYINAVWPGLPSKATALFLVSFFYLANMLGIRIAALLQGVLVLLLLSALFLYAGMGVVHLPSFSIGNTAQIHTGGIILGSALLTFTYAGANGIIELGGEMIRPERIIPRTFLIAFPIVAVIYILVSLATVCVLTHGELAAADNPLILANNRMGTAATRNFFILFGAVTALTTTLNAIIITGTKSFLVIVQDNIFPKFFDRLSRRFNTPLRILALFWLLSITGVMMETSLDTLAAYASLGALVLMIPIQWVAAVFPGKYPGAYHRAGFKLKGIWRFACPGVGMLLYLVSCLVILYDLGDTVKIAGFFLFVFSGALFFQ
ncbi:MAG: APC family permease, partial [Chlorobiales bacterium]|nr:APC family permease [Chlorobiales bacterium]